MSQPLSIQRRMAYAAVLGGAIMMAMPLYLLFVFATHTTAEITALPTPLWFGSAFLSNMRELTDRLPFFMHNLWLSVWVASVTALLQLLLCSMAGYAFAVLQFRFKDTLFALLLATMLLPAFVNMIPHVVLFNALGWLEKPIALIVPAAVSALGIFLMRQYISKAVPLELLEAGRLDGNSTWGLYIRIVLPIIKPALAVLLLIAFIGSWNNYIAPMLAIHDMERYTIPLTLRALAGQNGLPLGMLFAGTAVSMIPLLILFALCARTLFTNLMIDSTGNN